MTRPTRILYTIPNLVTAGSGRALYEVARRLDRERFEPAVCVEWRGRDEGERRLERLFEAAGIPVVEGATTVDPRPLATLPARVAAAGRRLRRLGRFDVWHSYHYLDDYTEPLVARVAGATWVFTKKSMSWNRRSWWLRSALARRIAAQNRDMLERFFDRPPLRSKAVLLPRGVDAERFRPPATEERRAARQALGLGDEVRAIGCVAQLVPVKGHATLLDAFARSNRQNAVLLLAGGPLDGETGRELTRRAETLGLGDRVRWLGRIDDVPRLLHALDLFVLPTRGGGRMEGCPVALLEAMASGLPTIATRIPGSRDLLAVGFGDEAPGRLIEPDDVDALAAALSDLLADPGERARLGAAARRRVEREHRIEREVARHEAFYDDLVRAGRGGADRMRPMLDVRHRLRLLGIRAWRRMPFPADVGRYRLKRWLEPPAGDGRRPVPTEVGWLHLEHDVDQVQRRLYMGGRHDERGVVARLRTLGREAYDAPLRGATALDVGGHCGFYTMLLADLVGPGGRVVAFEPQPELARAIEASAASNGFGHVRVVEAAAADRDGTLTFHRTDDSGHASLSDVGGEASRAVEVRAVALGDWIERQLRDPGGAIDAPPSLVKLDIEGAEWLVLRAARRQLAKYRPRLVVEVHPRQIEALGGDVGALLGELRGLGYVLRGIAADGRLEVLDAGGGSGRRGPWHLEAWHPEAGRPEAGRPEAGRPEAGRPETGPASAPGGG